MSSSSTDETWISGYWLELLIAAMVKRWLAGDMAVADRLELLSWLADRPKTSSHNGISADAVAALPPANDEVAGIVEDALRLNTDDEPTGFDLLTRTSTFMALVGLQPALRDAIVPAELR
jgi:hypothetical protein